MSKKVPVFGDCALCNNYAELKDSHIVPKFFIRAAGLTEESFSIICHSDRTKSKLNMQDGITEPLLCLDCERRLNRWETYASNAIYGENSQFANITNRGIIWTGLIYAPMKLLFTSILWRMSVCKKHGFYSDVNLGEKHEAVVREMLLSDNPGEVWQYGTTLGYLFLGGKPLLDGIFSQPHPIRTREGRTTYRFLMANFYVLIDVASHSPVPETYLHYLQPSGQWGVPVIEANSVNFIRGEIELFRRNADLYKHYRKKV